MKFDNELEIAVYMDMGYSRKAAEEKIANGFFVMTTDEYENKYRPQFPPEDTDSVEELKTVGSLYMKLHTYKGVEYVVQVAQ